MLKKAFYDKCSTKIIGDVMWCSTHSCDHLWCQRLEQHANAIIDLDQRLLPHKFPKNGGNLSRGKANPKNKDKPKAKGKK